MTELLGIFVMMIIKAKPLCKAIHLKVVSSMIRMANSHVSLYKMGKEGKEGNVVFNDALNTFYLRLYGVRHMAKVPSDSERGNPCRHIEYSFQLTARVLL